MKWNKTSMELAILIAIGMVVAYFTSYQVQYQFVSAVFGSLIGLLIIWWYIDLVSRTTALIMGIVFIALYIFAVQGLDRGMAMLICSVVYFAILLFLFFMREERDVNVGVSTAVFVVFLILPFLSEGMVHGTLYWGYAVWSMVALVFNDVLWPEGGWRVAR